MKPLQRTPLANTSAVFDSYQVTLPDGSVTTVESVLADARRARGQAIATWFRSLPKRGRRVRAQLAALFAPALGRNRQLRYLP